jgi:hypothetical protein
MSHEHDHDIDTMDAEYRNLVARRDSLQQDKARIEATLDARRKDLKSLLDQARKEGFDPDNLKDEIRRLKEVLRLKLDNFSTELDEAATMMDPMLKEIESE